MDLVWWYDVAFPAAMGAALGATATASVAAIVIVVQALRVAALKAAYDKLCADVAKLFAPTIDQAVAKMRDAMRLHDLHRAVAISRDEVRRAGAAAPNQVRFGEWQHSVRHSPIHDSEVAEMLSRWEGDGGK